MEEIEITIVNWEKYNDTRKDIKHHTWLRLQNKMGTSQSLFALSSSEKWAWICLLCEASQRATANVRFIKDWFCQVNSLREEDLLGAIRKLSENGTIKTADVTCTLRGVYATLRTLQTNTIAQKSDAPKSDMRSQQEHSGTRKKKPSAAPPDTLVQIYSKYPNKKGRKKGLAALSRLDPARHPDVCIAIENYKNELASEKTEKRFVKHFSTFMNCWEDWLDSTHAPLADWKPVDV